MDKEQALHEFWNGFRWAARDENTVQDATGRRARYTLWYWHES